MKPIAMLFTTMLLSAAVPHFSKPPVAMLAADDILARSRAAYAALKTYADSGTTMRRTEGFSDFAKFKTYYRKPRDFFFEYTGLREQGKNGSVPFPRHIVYWMLNGSLETWNAESKSRESFPAGVKNQITPIANGELSTLGSLPLIASMFFPKAALITALAELKTVSDGGMESVGGHPCHKLVGIAQSLYPSGATFNTRPVAVWIDAQTFLIRKLFVDTPKSYPIGTISQTTLTFYPTVNPTLDDKKFQYVAPSQ